jgi:pyruvate,orthophosphate dikinase
MEPPRSFESAALRVNLERTESQPGVMPREQQELVDAAAPQYGVANRLRQFLAEFHHRFPNDEWLATQLRSIALQDLWYYEALPQSTRHLSTLLRIMDTLLGRSPVHALKQRVFQTLLEFTEQLAAGEKGEGHASVIDAALGCMEQRLEADTELLVLSSSMLRSIFSATPAREDAGERVTAMFRRALEANLAFWTEGAYVERILRCYPSLFSEMREGLLAYGGREYFAAQRRRLAEAEDWTQLCGIPDFHAVAERFRKGGELFPTPMLRAYYISAILPLPGLGYLNEHLLWDLNQAIRSIQKKHGREKMTAFLDDMFRILATLRAGHPGTVLECLQTLGGIIQPTDDTELIDHFIDALIDFGFIHPRPGGTGQPGQSRGEEAHVKNIRAWLAIIEGNPRRSARLLSALIINLRLGGVFIADNDLFQRDVTALLNADVRSVSFLIKQLAILFPVYFNEIGAEGELRDISTVVDQLSGRRDRLLHFVRKQIHAESNNSHVRLTEEILAYWHDGSTEGLLPFLPDDVREAMEADTEWVSGSRAVVTHLCERLSLEPRALTSLSSSELAEAAADAYPVEDVHLQRVIHLCRIHQLLRQKYSIAVEDIIPHMEKLHHIREKDIDEFRGLMATDVPEDTLCFVLTMLRRLHEVFFDPAQSTAQEEIYHKRHIAAGIPSMYGRYMEPKFQALGLVFRFEALATQLFERIVAEANLRYITAGTLRRMHRILVLFRQSLEIEGYSDEGFSSTVEMLRFSLSTTSTTIHQYINLFQFLAGNVKSIIHSNFINPHEAQLARILPQHIAEGTHARMHAMSEQLYRDLISTTFPMQQLDNFIASVIASLSEMLKHLSPDVIQSAMGYDSRLTNTRLFEPNAELDNPVFLGAKGYYLKRLYALGFPVPPGFVLTTELFRRRDAITHHPDMSAEIDDLIRTRLGNLESLGRFRFGDPARPLLLSVRSGAAVSIPGAMNTFLNVGMNEEVAEGLSRQENFAWTAWDCYRRFLQTWGMVQGIARDDFDAVIIDHKERCGVEQKMQFTPAQMRAIAAAYRRVLADHGVMLEDDAFRQLRQAVLMVLDSWYTERAEVYRSKLQIAEDWGTAVVVQQMVLGNLNDDSGSGVVFTHDPHVHDQGIHLYGDFTVCSQGEDIVAGLVHTLPISEQQRLRSQSPVGQSLEKDFPDIYRQLEQYASSIVFEHNFGHQEIEFTFESRDPADLHILQTRDHSLLRERQTPVFEIDAARGAQVGSGIGSGGGAMNGLVCFDGDDLRRLRAERPEQQLILIRPDTVPDDIGMIFECDGLLTARGGATSHAAVTAVRLKKTCVVDCRDLRVDEAGKTCTINGVEFRPGDAIAIDGRLGSIYRGTLAVSYEHIQMP